MHLFDFGLLVLGCTALWVESKTWSSELAKSFKIEMNSKKYFMPLSLARIIRRGIMARGVFSEKRMPCLDL